LEYDPVKDRLQALLGDNPWLRNLFFVALDHLFLRSRYIRRELRRLAQEGFRPAKILDAGAGFGQYSVQLAKIFPAAQICALDVKEDLVAAGNDFARRMGLRNIVFETGDLLNIGYEAQFDLVLSVDVMEHIREDRIVFHNIGASLKPGGYFLMTTPYYDPGRPQTASESAVFTAEHVRPGYSRVELEGKLSDADMHIEKFVITYGRYGGVAWKLLQKKPMSWLSGRPWLLPVVALYLGSVYPFARVMMELDMRRTNKTGGGIFVAARKR
jgi:2-polyprenyl-3-methyl-5-hydroxy-6-metoxy-1,4-benzoquinol methylase